MFSPLFWIAINFVHVSSFVSVSLWLIGLSISISAFSTLDSKIHEGRDSFTVKLTSPGTEIDT